MKSINPRRVPRSQADVNKAYEKGREDGARGTLTIVLYTLQDKFGADEAQLTEFSEAFNYTVDSLNRGYIKETDLMSVLKTEYGTEIEVRDE